MNRGNIIKSLIPPRVRRLLLDLLGMKALRSKGSFNHDGSSPEKTLELARGYFGRLEYHEGNLAISGWMLLPHREFDAFAAYINQHKLKEAAPIERRDVAQVFPSIPHAKHSGFSFSLHRRPEEIEGTIDIHVVGASKGREIAKIETWYRTDLYSCVFDILKGTHLAEL